MKTNVGMFDRVVRVAIAAGAFWVFFTGARPNWEYAVLAIGVVMALTGLVGTCPLYSLFGVKTCKSNGA